MYQIRKQNKYGNVKQTYEGYSYMSKKEAAYAQELDLRVRAKDIKSWDRQVKLSMDVNGHHICNYYIDFKIFHNDGSEELTEIKGFQTDVWRIKWKLCEALYGDKYKLTVIK